MDGAGAPGDHFAPHGFMGQTVAPEGCPFTNRNARQGAVVRQAPSATAAKVRDPARGLREIRPRADRVPGSGVRAPVLGRMPRSYQAATPGNLMRGSSLTGARLSRLM